MRRGIGDQETGPTRGMDEVKAQQNKDGHKDKISQATVTVGKELLSDFASSMNIKLKPDQLQVYLELLLSNTEFEEAEIVYRGNADHGFQRKFPVYKNMSVIYGAYPQDSYNIWFQRIGGKWVLSYNTIPAGGNWRGSK